MKPDTTQSITPRERRPAEGKAIGHYLPDRADQ